MHRPRAGLSDLGDIFIADVAAVTSNAHAPTLGSVNSDGDPATRGGIGDASSFGPMLTSDGLHVVFVSDADNLAEQADTNGANDIFVRHLEVGRTRRMNLDCTDEEATTAPMVIDDSRAPDIFLDGQAVVCRSTATNLLDPSQDSPVGPDPDSSGLTDIFESRLEPRFVRGDANSDGNVNISDPIFILNFLFGSEDRPGPRPECMDAADADDQLNVNMNDPNFLLRFLFQGGPPPPPPFPGCAFDPTDDCISCKKRGPSCPDDHSHGPPVPP